MNYLLPTPAYQLPIFPPPYSPVPACHLPAFHYEPPHLHHTVPQYGNLERNTEYGRNLEVGGRDWRTGERMWNTLGLMGMERQEISGVGGLGGWDDEAEVEDGSLEEEEAIDQVETPLTTFLRYEQKKAVSSVSPHATFFGPFVPCAQLQDSVSKYVVNLSSSRSSLTPAPSHRITLEGEVTTTSFIPPTDSSSTWLCYRRNLIALDIRVTLSSPTSISTLLVAGHASPIDHFSVRVSAQDHETESGAAIMQLDSSRQATQGTEVQPVRIGAPNLSEGQTLVWDDGAIDEFGGGAFEYDPPTSSSGSSPSYSPLSSPSTSLLSSSQHSHSFPFDPILEAQSFSNIITFRRLQFRNSTLYNNRGSSKQGEYSMGITIVAVLADGGEEVPLGSFRSAGLVVRGRSPGSFDKKKSKARNKKRAQSTSPGRADEEQEEQKEQQRSMKRVKVDARDYEDGYGGIEQRTRQRTNVDYRE
jgi:hypothetical protein